jgi:hypothetical protein
MPASTTLVSPLVLRLERAEATNRRLRKDLARWRTRCHEAEADRGTFERAIALAQCMAAQIVADAEVLAEGMLRDAQRRAEELVADAEKQAQRPLLVFDDFMSPDIGDEPSREWMLRGA